MKEKKYFILGFKVESNLKCACKIKVLNQYWIKRYLSMHPDNTYGILTSISDSLNYIDWWN